MNPKIYTPQLMSIIAQAQALSKELDKIANDVATFTPKDISDNELLKAKLADQIVTASFIMSKTAHNLLELEATIITLQSKPAEPRVQRWIFQDGKPIPATIEDVAKVRGMTVPELMATEEREEAEAYDIIDGEES